MSRSRGAGIGGQRPVVFGLLALAIGLDLSKQDIVAGPDRTCGTDGGGGCFTPKGSPGTLPRLFLIGLAVVILSSPATVRHLVPWFMVAATAVVLVLAGRELRARGFVFRGYSFTFARFSTARRVG